MPDMARTRCSSSADRCLRRADLGVVARAGRRLRLRFLRARLGLRRPRFLLRRLRLGRLGALRRLLEPRLGLGSAHLGRVPQLLQLLRAACLLAGRRLELLEPGLGLGGAHLRALPSLVELKHGRLGATRLLTRRRLDLLELRLQPGRALVGLLHLLLQRGVLGVAVDRGLLQGLESPRSCSISSPSCCSAPRPRRACPAARPPRPAPGDALPWASSSSVCSWPRSACCRWIVWWNCCRSAWRVSSSSVRASMVACASASCGLRLAGLRAQLLQLDLQLGQLGARQALRLAQLRLERVDARLVVALLPLELGLAPPRACPAARRAPAAGW